jgi:hypothetical protein
MKVMKKLAGRSVMKMKTSRKSMNIKLKMKMEFQSALSG